LLTSFNKLKLRHQLAMLVAIAAVMIIGVQVFYITWFNSVTQSRTEVTVNNIISQVQENLISTAANMKELATTVAYDRFVQEYLVEKDNIKRKALVDTTSNYMNYISASNKEIHNIILVDNSEYIFSLYSNNDFEVINSLMKKYNFNDIKFKAPMFSTIIPESANSKTFYYAYITPVFSLSKGDEPNTKIGTCIVLHKVYDLQNIIQKVSIFNDALFLVEDRENRIVAANNRYMNGSFFNEKLYDESIDYAGKVEKSFHDRKSIIQQRVIRDLDFKIVSVIPMEEMTREMNHIRNVGFLIGLAMTLLLLIIGLLFSRNITRPIGKIISFLESIGENYLHKRLHMKEMNEIGQLTLYINKMLGNIEDINKRIVNTQSSLYEMELARKQAELSSLQNQINPHFLYNTLNCIQSIGLVAGSMDIVNISSSLIKIFRYSIKGESFVDIKTELECITDYLSIMSIRYRGKFVTRINVDEGLMNMKTIKMILQPIVENAMYHGLECKKGQGNLEIRGFLKNENNVVFEVIDNGIGISENQLAKITYYLNKDENYNNIDKNDRISIGLINIHNRIKLNFGKDYGLEIFSKENEGTKVVLNIPAIRD
jgi:two-component system, sensor histidine kinase YesM